MKNIKLDNFEKEIEKNAEQFVKVPKKKSKELIRLSQKQMRRIELLSV